MGMIAPEASPRPEGGVGRAIDTTLAALADPIRRRVVEELARRPHRSGELAEVAGVSAATMSKHLGVLRRSGLVAAEHPAVDTRVRIYSLASAPMVELRAWLAAAEKGWNDQLAAFAEHLADTPESVG